MSASGIRNSLHRLIGLLAEPVSVTFSDTEPEGIERIGKAAPAGCAYWKIAAEGNSFYTAASDHLNCPIGAYTHGGELTSDAEGQLRGMIERMVSIQYLKIEEVPGIPRRTTPLRYVVYAPLSQAQVRPDVVLLRGNARQMMLVVEASSARGLMSTLPIMGRPACAVIAAAIDSGKAATSLGCIGNRVYTDLPDDEFYVALPWPTLEETVDALESIVAANAELEQFHRGRCACA